MSKDENIYSTSSFIHLLRAKHGLDIISLSTLLKMTQRDIKEMIKGREQLGRDNYFKIIEHIGEDIQCDYTGTYGEIR